MWTDINVIHEEEKYDKAWWIHRRERLTDDEYEVSTTWYRGPL